MCVLHSIKKSVCPSTKKIIFFLQKKKIEDRIKWLQKNVIDARTIFLKINLIEKDVPTAISIIQNNKN